MRRSNISKEIQIPRFRGTRKSSEARGLAPGIFIQSTAQTDKGQGTFELETERLLELNLNGKVHTKMGSMVAYNGQAKFTREGIMSRGVGNLLKKAVSGEGARITDPNATVAWSGSLEPQIKTDVSLKSFFGRGSGESFQMLFEGSGFVTIQPYEEVSFQTTS